MSIGKRIKTLRMKLKMSQQDLADKSGVSQQLIGQLESDPDKTTRKLVEIAAALETTAEHLTSGEPTLKVVSSNVHPTTHQLDIGALTIFYEWIEEPDIAALWEASTTRERASIQRDAMEVINHDMSRGITERNEAGMHLVAVKNKK